MNCIQKSIIYSIICSVVVMVVGMFLPRDKFNYNKAPYKQYKWEENTTLYSRIKITRWKDKLPDISRIFKRVMTKSISQLNINKQQIENLIAETCVAEICHVVLIVLITRVMFIWNGKGGFCFFVLYGLLGNIPFILIQRYNRPRLVKLLHRLEKKDENTHSDL